MDEKSFIAALPLADLPPGSKTVADVDGHAVLVCNDGGTIRAVANLCSHAEQALDCGRMMHGWIACPAHGARFDLATGDALNPPAINPIRVYATRIVHGMIEVAP